MLVHNWRAVLKRAWSVRLMALAFIIIIVEPVYLFFAANWVAKSVYVQLAMSVVTGLLTAAAIVARLVFQRKVSEDIANGKPPAEG